MNMNLTNLHILGSKQAFIKHFRDNLALRILRMCLPISLRALWLLVLMSTTLAPMKARADQCDVCTCYVAFEGACCRGKCDRVWYMNDMRDSIRATTFVSNCLTNDPFGQNPWS